MTIEYIYVEPSHGGRGVQCDSCGEDYTDSKATGGIMFDSKAICPKCSPSWLESAERHNELHAIRAWCPANTTFADWVRESLR